MAIVQTRRSISFSLADFEAAQRLAAHLKIPVAQLAAQALREMISRHAGRPAREDPYPRSDATPVTVDAPAPVHGRPQAVEIDSTDLARVLQADLDARVGVLPRAPVATAESKEWGVKSCVYAEGDVPDVDEVQVVYDDGPPKTPHNPKRKRR